MAKPSGLTNVVLNVIGTLFPQFAPTPNQWYGLTMDSVKKQYEVAGGNCIETLAQWNNNYHCYAYRFNHPDSMGLRLSSGIDTRSTNLAGFVQSTGLSSATSCTVICEVTSVLKIQAGLQIAVII